MTLHTVHNMHYIIHVHTYNTCTSTHMQNNYMYICYFNFFAVDHSTQKNQTGLKNVKLNNKISEPAQHDDKYQAYGRHGQPVRHFRNLRNLSHGSFGNFCQIV